MPPIIEITDREEARRKREFRENLWSLACLVLGTALLAGFFYLVFHQDAAPQPVWIEARLPGKTVAEINNLPRALVLAAIAKGKGDVRYHLLMRGKTTPAFNEGGSLRDEYREKYPDDIIWVDANTVWIASVRPEPVPHYFRVVPKPKEDE